MKYPFYIPCKKATYLISKQQETKLTVKEKIQLSVHLFVCSVCKLFKKQTNQVLNLLKHKKNNTPVLNENAKQKIKIKLDEVITSAE
ncbi:MAG: hypothetical protein ACOVO1_07815 [Chitinophagaceae bacterium]